MKISKARDIMTGTAEATLPTSSSNCMIFLIRAGGNRALNFFFLLGIFFLRFSDEVFDKDHVSKVFYLSYEVNRFL